LLGHKKDDEIQLKIKENIAKQKDINELGEELNKKEIHMRELYSMV
jgi:hypothetical protein